MSFLVFCATKKPQEISTAIVLSVKVKFYAFHFTSWFVFCPSFENLQSERQGRFVNTQELVLRLLRQKLPSLQRPIEHLNFETLLLKLNEDLKAGLLLSDR